MEKRVSFSTKWYEMRVHLGVLRYAQQYHWDVFSSHHMPDSIHEIPGLDGLIVEIGPNDRRRLQLAQNFKGPIVALEDFGDGLDVPRVHTDNHAVGQLAAGHFIERGFTRFITVCQANHQYVQDRLEAFHQAISRVQGAQCLDIRLNRSGEIQDKSSGSAATSFIEILSTLKRPIGIFCVDDDDAADLIRTLKKDGIAIPEEVAVVGVNDDPLICPFALVPITSIDPGFEDIGFKAAQLLHRMMRGEKVDSKTHRVKPKGIMVRRSSDIRAVEDVHIAKAIRFIWDHSDQWRSVKDVSTHVNLPTRTLQWRFKKAMGYSLQDEITRSRIDNIKDRLIRTDRSIQQIADEMDFSSVQYLIRLFSKETGLSPLKFRRQHRTNR